MGEVLSSMMLATEIAAHGGCIIYDALFVSIAESEDTVVVTADEKLLKLWREHLTLGEGCISEMQRMFSRTTEYPARSLVHRVAESEAFRNEGIVRLLAVEPEYGVMIPPPLEPQSHAPAARRFVRDGPGHLRGGSLSVGRRV